MNERQVRDVIPGTADERIAASASRVAAAVPVPSRAVAGLLALLSVAVTTLYRVLHTAPVTLPEPVTTAASLALPAASIVTALAALLLATTAASPGERVGLAFAGGFAPLALASPTAWVPAAAGTVCGGCAVALAHVRRSWRRGGVPAACRGGVASLLLFGVGVSLAATAGVASATLRPLGTGVALVGVGALPAAIGSDRTALLAGAVAGALALWLATGAPYVAGAVLLVGGGVVGVPIAFVVLAVAGGVAALVSALRRGRSEAVVGVGLALAAGVPTTLLRALGVVVAVAVLVGAPGGEHA